MRKKLRTTKKCKNVWDFTIEEREIPMSENAHYRQKLLKQILTDLALDTFAKYHIL
ncbi:MAG: hypothetical protein J0L93_08320 [Deltaproteobacteria bacterium]|nr:hypothetical protein [Deltaproteobacteria bacterium]